MQLDTWQVILFCIALIGGFGTLIKILFMQFDKALDKRFETMGERLNGIEHDSREWARVERELLRFMADIPLHYVRREDYVRNQTIIESKIDAVALKLENITLKGATNREH